MSTILLVEDEELNRTLVKAVLARAKIESVRDARVLDATSIAAATASPWPANWPRARCHRAAPSRSWSP